MGPDILQRIKADWSIKEEKAITECIAREIVTIVLELFLFLAVQSSIVNENGTI